MRKTLIYHAIGTLTHDHFRWSMESLNNQDIYWNNFVLYNHSDRPDDMILHWLDYTQFGRVSVFDRKNDIKGAIADWEEQFREIGNSDIYFVHKADFYLADGCLKRFEKICDIDPLFVGVKKFDMFETTEIQDIRKMAKKRSFDRCSEFHKLYGCAYDPAKEPKWDGVMHGYSTGVRPVFNADKNQIQLKYGACLVFDNMDVEKITDDGVYAMHMFHELPFKEREEKKQLMGMRY